MQISNPDLLFWNVENKILTVWYLICGEDWSPLHYGAMTRKTSCAGIKVNLRKDLCEKYLIPVRQVRWYQTTTYI